MLLLDALIDHHGPFGSWPTYIVQHLFIDRPSPARTSRLRKVISFFYGNEFPLKMAYTMSAVDARFVVYQTRQWQCSKFKLHIAKYYSMLFINKNVLH